MSGVCSAPRVSVRARTVGSTVCPASDQPRVCPSEHVLSGAEVLCVRCLTRPRVSVRARTVWSGSTVCLASDQPRVCPSEHVLSGAEVRGEVRRSGPLLAALGDPRGDHQCAGRPRGGRHQQVPRVGGVHSRLRPVLRTKTGATDVIIIIISNPFSKYTSKQNLNYTSSALAMWTWA